jgi:elongation factor Ts
MANIENIKILRERTGAGIMDCKHALEACGDDVDKATDRLREKGIAKQAKKADRIAAEGLALVATAENKAAVVEVNCETDFVANSDPFRNLVKDASEKALDDSIANLEALKSAVKGEFDDAALKLGEKISVRRFDRVTKKDPTNGIATYVHGGGKIAVIVLLEKDDPELAKGIAMHVAANSPKYVLDSDIPQEVIDNERKVQIEVCKNDPKLAAKPEKVLEGIVAGKVHKTLGESVLVEQLYLLDSEKTVAKVLAEKGNKVLTFVRYQVGEGIEKRVDNFAEEVMSQAK